MLTPQVPRYPGWWSRRSRWQRAALITGFYLLGIGSIASIVVGAGALGLFAPDAGAIPSATATPQPSAPAFVRYQPSERTPRPVPTACTHTIPSEVVTIDGAENYASVGPGDVLCLPAGTRGNLKLFNLHGTSEQPITIRNADGVVRITGATQKTGGIGLIASSWIHVSGAGVSAQCGAEYEAAEQECGIQIDNVYNGIRILTEGDVHDFEIDHVSVRATSTLNHSTGFSIHPQPQQTLAGLYIHHNYLSDIHREGMYLGTEPKDNPLPTLGKLTNVEISYNLVERTGYDGIKLKVATENVSVHDNIVRDAAIAKFLHHETGIQLTTSVGDVYNNVVEGGVEGIATGRPLTDPATKYFNNVIVGTQAVGMKITEDRALVFNNTIIEGGAVGVDVRGLEARVFDNIVVGSTRAPITGRTVTDFRNLIGDVASAGFVDLAAGDYRLERTSPAVDSGARDGPIPAFDLERVPRPQGMHTDRGAYEFRPSAAAGR